MTLSYISPNLSKHNLKIFSVLAEFLLWELSIVSSLSLYSILVQHACNDHAWLTSECVALLDFFAKAQEAQELIKNCELNLYVSRDGLSHCTISYPGKHSEVSQAR